MHIEYDIKNCSHCDSNDIVTMGNENQIYGLVSITADNNGKTNVELDSFLPVVATVCRNCGHVDLIHIDCKSIKPNK